jgi:amino acid transporter
MNKLKNLLAAGSSTAIYLAYAGAAHAQAINVDPCEGVNAGPGTGWNQVLCGTAQNPGDTIRNVILAVFVIATLVALFFLILGGIRWITSGGDKAKVDTARSTIIAAIVGLIIVFLSYFVLNLVLGAFGINAGVGKDSQLQVDQNLTD